MERLAATCVVLLAAIGLADDETAPRQEWKLPSGVAVFAVSFTGQGAPTAVDLTGAVAQFTGFDRELRPFKARGLTCVAVLPDASAAFAGLASGSVWRWDLATGERTQASSGHGSTVACAAVSPDGRLIATGS